MSKKRDEWYKYIIQESDVLKRKNKERRANKLKRKKREERRAEPLRSPEGKIYNGHMGTWVDEEK